VRLRIIGVELSTLKDNPLIQQSLTQEYLSLTLMHHFENIMQTTIENDNGIRLITLLPDDNDTPEIDNALYQVTDQPVGSLQELLIAWSERMKQKNSSQSNELFPLHFYFNLI
jgi:hypothetical protein